MKHHVCMIFLWKFQQNQRITSVVITSYVPLSNSQGFRNFSDMHFNMVFIYMYDVSCIFALCELSILVFMLRYLLFIVPNQELSVLNGGPTLNYGEQLSLYVPHMLCVNMTGDLAHLQLSDLQAEIKPICRTSNLQGERMLILRT